MARLLAHSRSVDRYEGSRGSGVKTVRQKRFERNCPIVENDSVNLNNSHLSPDTLPHLEHHFLPAKRVKRNVSPPPVAVKHRSNLGDRRCFLRAPIIAPPHKPRKPEGKPPPAPPVTVTGMDPALADLTPQHLGHPNRCKPEIRRRTLHGCVD